ncbi:cutinase family protein [Leucobacter sp. wl10]|uniref:cutinase family protein n=1 Tax=Leucobacter sp. wl10 TaxID=2304677 RepID=UPI000E5BB6EE|nr:cutinase family protein [Leucobacter sp. wl10]RGE17943.1 cutinase family protein [Leucobacter sp. wl10]
MRRLPLLALIPGLALSLVACAPSVDPSETRESLAEVTEDPAPPDAADELDADLNPEPVVDPLDCSPYLVITARGTGEPSRGQLLSPVAKAVSDARPGEVQRLDLEYPADTDVKEGGTVGARTLIDTLNVQAQTCEEQRFILLGYSQGALVIGDALSSPDVRLVGQTVGEVSEEAVERVLAIVFYGNPRFVGSEPFDYGSYDPRLNGILPRPPGSLDAYADRVRDYCVAGDFVCQSSLDLDEEPHVEYYTNGMPQDGAAFVVTRMDPPRRDPTSEGAPG